mmetsp:Transcript_88419/g.230454  ORF Transcript_88419/g.230454 Transcript_88419/m.230454 type:complete len:264 (-) Transcript_88419:1213-2004(-)
MLHNVDLWAGEGVDGAVVAVRPAPEREDASVARVAQAGHPWQQQAHQHLPRAIWRRGAAEVAVGDVLRVPREVGAGAPQRSTACAASEGLEARHRVGDNGLHGVRARAMEPPAGVAPWLESQALVLERAPQGAEIRLHAPLDLRPVLDALHPQHTHLLPSPGWPENVGGGLPGRGLERGGDHLELLLKRGHLGQLRRLRAREEETVPTAPALTELLRRQPQPLLGRSASLVQALAPRPRHVGLWALGRQGRVQQARQAVVGQQ